MGCNWKRFPDGTVAHFRTSGKRSSRCHKCILVSEFQCDFPIGGGKTCDRHLCTDHVQHGATKGIDFCEEHYPIAKAAYEKRRMKQGMDLLFDPNMNTDE